MAKKSRSFTRNGGSYNIEADYFTTTEPASGDRGNYTEEEVDFTLEYVEYCWRLYMDLGFDSFGFSSNGATKYEVFFDASKLGNGEANDVRTTIDTKRRRDGNESGFKGLLLHELFHGCQYALDYPHKEQKAFIEGTANIAAFLCDLDVRRDIGISDYQGYLENTGATMWDRPSPGKSKDNRGTATLWWLYFCDQVGVELDDPGIKMDALRDLIKSDFSPINPWLSRNSEVAAVGNFLGNGDDQILYHWRHSQYGLVSFNDSFGGNGATHRVTSHGERWGQSIGWRQREEDRIVGKGRLVGNGRDQLVITSKNPAHIGIIGFTQSDGSPDRPQSLETYAVVGGDNRWGINGWKVREEDEVVAIGNFMNSDTDQIAVFSNSSRHFAIIGLKEDGSLTTYFSMLEGSSFGRDGWVLNETDRIVGTGDFVGNGLKQLLIQSDNPWAFGIVGFEADGSPKTYANVINNERFGDGWKVRVEDRILGTGYLASGDRCQIIIANNNPSYLGIVGLSGSGETETIKVILDGSEIGEDWEWKASDRFIGTGYFEPGEKQQFVLMSESPRRMGVIGLDSNEEFVTYDYVEAGRGGGAPENVFAIGDFAGLGRDQFYSERGPYLLNLAYEKPKHDDRGHWRDRFAINKNTYFYSTHIFLNQYLVRKTGRRFIDFWRDFTVTNATKDLVGAPNTLSYSFGNLPPTPVSITAGLNSAATVQNFSLNRWAAAYFDIDTVSGLSRVRLKGEVKNNQPGVFWTVVLQKQDGRFKSVIQFSGQSFDEIISIDADDVLKLVVTTTYSNVEIQLSNLG